MRRAALLALLVLTLGCQGVGKLDLTTLGRDSWQRPGDVVAALELRPGDRVADLGAGEGYFVSYLSEAVGPEGRVYAVEVDEDLVSSLRDRFPPDDGNVEAVLGGFEDPGLEEGSVDVVLIVNTYHHIEDRSDYFRRLRRDLRPGGRVAVIEPNSDLGGLLSLTLDEGHTSSAPAVVDEMSQAGYRVHATHEILPVQIFEVFAVEEDADVADAR